MPIFFLLNSFAGNLTGKGQAGVSRKSLESRIAIVGTD
jgi:hypothetical protein